MAGNLGQWELVVKGSKKKNTSVINGKLSRNEKKQFTETAPKINKYGLVATGTGNEGKENKQPKQNASNQHHDTKKKKNDKKKEETPRQPRDLEEAMAKITLNDVKNLMELFTSKFKDSPLIWMKDLASFLNVKINPSAVRDPGFRNDPTDYPVALLNPEVKKLFFTTFSECSDSVLSSFHHYCLHSMVHEIPKGLTVYGYKLFLQLLAQYKPTICITHLDEYCNLRQSYPNQVSPTISLLWAVGQAGKKDFAIALQVWQELMFPLIKLKNYSAFVINYGTSMFTDRVMPDQDYSDYLGVGAFFSVFDFIWMSSSSLSKPLQSQLLNLYHKLKAITLNPRKDLHSFFPNFLTRLKIENSEQLNKEVLLCLTQCLTSDLKCWDIWKQLYLKNVYQSAMLLQHLNTEWRKERSASLMSKSEVQEVINSFVEVNKSIEHKIHAVTGLREAIHETNELSEFINKECKSSKLFSWTSLLVLVLVLAITSDIRRHSSFQESHVGKLLDKLGLTIHLEKLGKGFRIYMKLMYKWCQVNIPIYYSKGCDLAGPYLSLFLDRCNVIITVIYQTFVLLVNSITMYIPTLLKRIDAMMPGAAEAISNFGAKIIELLIYYWAIVCKTLSPLFLEVHNFLITRVLIGPLEPMVLYGHLTSAYKYALESTNLLYYSVIQMLQDD